MSASDLGRNGVQACCERALRSQDSSLQADGTIHHFIGDASVSWIDTDDIAAVAAAILLAPAGHHGQTYPLAVESRSIGQVAEVLADVLGRSFRYEPKSPDEWLAAALARGLEPVYAHCVHNVFCRQRDGTLRDAADVHTTFEEITGNKPTLWRDHAEKYREAFLNRAGF